jgi:hypothetical protein
MYKSLLYKYVNQQMKTQKINKQILSQCLACSFIKVNWFSSQNANRRWKACDKGNKPAHIQAGIEKKIINEAIKLKKTKTTE